MRLRSSTALLAILSLAMATWLTGCGSDTVVERSTTDPLADLDFDPEGDATFQVVGTEAYMAGVIGSSTPDAVEQLLEGYPDVTTIVLVEVPGSGDDEANLQAARAVRDAGLATHVPASGEVASGGTDFFLAGAERSFEPGARFGVHGWSAGDGGPEAADLEVDDPEHDRYLDYYQAIGVDEEFYWFTIDAAPAADIHWMSASELDRFGFATS